MKDKILNFFKNIDYKFWIPIFLAFIFVGIVFFQGSLYVPQDGSMYFYYTRVFDGIDALSTWNRVRGFTFPFILYIIKHLFGNNERGLLIGFFLFYVFFCLSCIALLKAVLRENSKKKNSKLIWIIFFFLIMMNPLIIGYSHILLTEAVAPALIMYTCYLIYKWKDITWKKDKRKFVLYVLQFSFIVIFMWFLKQPYMPIIVFIMGISAILLAIKEKSWMMLFEKCGAILVTFVFLFISIVTWNVLLERNGASDEVDSFYISKGIIQGQNAYYSEVPKDTFCSEEYISLSAVSESEKNEIEKLILKNENWCDHIKVFDVLDLKRETIGQTYLYFEGTYPNVKESLLYLLRNTYKRPGYTLSAYYRNYLAMANVYSSTVITYELGYYPGNEFKWNAEHENITFAKIPYSNNVMGWWQYEGFPEEFYQNAEALYMENFTGVGDTSKVVGKMMTTLISPFLILFKFAIALALPMGIYTFIKFLRNRNNNVYYLSTILFVSAFLHTLFHAVFGSIIDRYAVVVFPAILLGFIILFINFQKNRKMAFSHVSTTIKKSREKIDNERIIGVDLLRIVSMIMIVTLHVLLHGGFVSMVQPSLSIKYCALWFIEIMCYCAVNTYAVISGFVGVNKQFKLKKIVILWAQVLFYSLGIAVIYNFLHPGVLNKVNWLKAIFPITNDEYWYISSYLGLLILSPVLNFFANKIDRKTFKKMLILTFVFYSLIPTVLKYVTLSAAFEVRNLNFGYNTLWLCVMYLTGAYIVKYVDLSKIKERKCLILYFLMVIITFLSKCGMEYMGFNNYSLFMIGYTSPTIMLCSVFLLIFFAKLNIKKAHKFIMMISNATLGVYLIHENYLFRQEVLINSLTPYLDNRFLYLFSRIILIVLFIYIFSTVVDVVRGYLFKFLKVDKIAKTIAKPLEEQLNKSCDV